MTKIDIVPEHAFSESLHQIYGILKHRDVHKIPILMNTK